MPCALCPLCPVPCALCPVPRDPLCRQDHKLDIKKNAKGMVFVPGATVKHADTLEELQAIWKFGEAHRHVGATKMNAGSSRSHLIFSIVIETTNKSTGDARGLPQNNLLR